MSPEQIGAIFAGIVTVLSTTATYAATRNKRLVRSERDLRKWSEVALAYIYRLRRQVIALGQSPVKAPKELELETHDEEGATDGAS